MDDKIKLLQQYIDESNNIVFFGGAGVSTESGIKDFRSVDGLYHEKFKYPPETMLSHSFFIDHTEEFYDFYREKLNSLNIEPNITHKYLKDLEDSGKLKAVITQNIDGLHEKAGSKNVLLLHGTVYKILVWIVVKNIMLNQSLIVSGFLDVNVVVLLNLM